MDAELLAAARDARVHADLCSKVSRERIGIELDGMLCGPRPIASLRALPANADVAQWACRALCNTSNCEAGQQAAVEAEGPTAIVAALRACRANAEVAHYACWALGNIAASFEGRRAALDADAAHAIMATLKVHAGNADVAHWAKRLLERLR